MGLERTKGGVMSEFGIFVVGIVIGWGLSCRFSTCWEVEWQWEEIPPYSKDNKK
jgi:hypothetical protein